METLFNMIYDFCQIIYVETHDGYSAESVAEMYWTATLVLSITASLAVVAILPLVKTAIKWVWGVLKVWTSPIAFYVFHHREYVAMHRWERVVASAKANGGKVVRIN